MATLAALIGNHSVTVPSHRFLRIGALGQIVSQVAAFVGSTEKGLRDKLLGR